MEGDARGGFGGSFSGCSANTWAGGWVYLFVAGLDVSTWALVIVLGLEERNRRDTGIQGLRALWFGHRPPWPVGDRGSPELQRSGDSGNQFQNRGHG